MPRAGNGPAKTTYCRRDEHKACPGQFRNAHMATPLAEAGRPCRCACHGWKKPPDLEVRRDAAGSVVGLTMNGRKGVEEAMKIIKQEKRNARRLEKIQAKDGKRG